MRVLLAESLAALKYYRRRTLVTIASLGWGVACFLTLMAYGNGYEAVMESAFRAVGQDLIVMFGGQTSQQAGGKRTGRYVRIEISDLDAIRENASGVGYISPEKFVGLPVVRGNREKQYTVRGVREEYRFIRNITLASGRWLNDEDGLHRNRVAVLGAEVAHELFSAIPAEGEEITIGGVRFRVAGVLEAKGQLAQYHANDNNSVFIPYDTMALYTNTRYPDVVVWSPVSGLVRADAVRQVRATLATIHRYPASDNAAVEMVIFNDFLYIITGMELAAKILVGFIGTLTLVIGGVGLANIMLASVVERTREIGVLKALGGRQWMIRAQFLVEGLLVVASGGFLGVIFGAALTALIGSMPLLGPLFEDVAAAKGDLHLRISLGTVLLSTGVLLVVGLIAGMVPAIKASRLDPIEALRYE